MPRDEKPDHDSDARGLDASSPTVTEGPEAATEGFGAGREGLAVGKNLGGRYQVVGRLGAGGMGEVWRAFDLKLRVEVALKALREDLFKDEKRLEMLRQEVRAAREVVSPNVCRIFDLVEADGRELVSMEYVDGDTLLHVLQERGPLDLKEAQDIASQFLAGLEAIHRAGLVHRDVKPENIMLTRAGRVVLMDFGLARGEDSGAGTVAGTPAYMAPEQAAGLKVDARADVYSAGVVLAEMVSPEGIRSLETRQSVWEGVRSEPAKLPDSPWAPVLKKAVAKEPEQRYNSAHTLTRALEEMTLRVEGAEDLHPYPGLASFTEEDAEYFFGREAEVEQMWAKLGGPPRLLGLVGPSGAGKTSFLGAGLAPSSPAGWGMVRCTPGNAVISSLRRALIPELAGDAEVLQALVDSDSDDALVAAVSRWRRKYDRALLIVDQFEELFTLNPPDRQVRCAELLGRVALEADASVLLSLRDDFLMECNRQRSLGPIASDLTLLDPPTGANLRRAVVGPATKCGYRFEDDELVDEMLAEVEDERGALPLLAFAMARLWEKRDRENGLLTRQAYHDIGGVGGALARHAEETVDRIGSDRVPVVRELFRNLVTAEGTRAVREWDELLSVFEEQQRESAEEVLRELIDARLLTSYEVQEEGREPTRRAEIIHESLLAAWPRLVRWRTQDQEGAQLRDELRQAARSWDEHERPEDRLWTGTAFREFQVWRERYPGGLTEVEEAFAEAMTSLATRRRRRRRMVAAAGVLLFASIAAVFAGLWRRSVSETRRAAGAELVALGQLQLESYPSATVAHTIASLDLADSAEARRLALEALWKGPTARVASEDRAWYFRFTPEGRSLVKSRAMASGEDVGQLLTLYSADGSSASLKSVPGTATLTLLSAISASGHFASMRGDEDLAWNIATWSVASDEPLAETRLEPSRFLRGIVIDSNRRRAVMLLIEDDRVNVETLGFDGTSERLGTLDFEFRFDDAERRWTSHVCLDSQAAEWLGVASQNEVYVVDVGDHQIGTPRPLGRQNGVLSKLGCDPLGRYIATASEDGEVRFWSVTDRTAPILIQGPPNSMRIRFTRDGSLFEAAVEEDGDWVLWVWTLAGESPRFYRQINIGGSDWGGWAWDTDDRILARRGPDSKFRLWLMDGPADADPLVLQRGDNLQANSLAFNPQGGWLATTDLAGLALWPLGNTYPMVIRRHETDVNSLAFSPDGSWVASASHDGTVRIWPLAGDPSAPGTVLFESDSLMNGLAVSPDGLRLLSSSNTAGTRILFPEGQASMTLEGFEGQTWGVAFSGDGRLAAAAGGQHNPAEREIRIWDAESREVVRVLEVEERPQPFNLQFTPDGRLLSASESGLLRWDVETGDRELLFQGRIREFAASTDGRLVLMVEYDRSAELFGRAVILDLGSGAVRRLASFGKDVTCVTLDSSGTLAVTGDKDGEIRVGSLNGDKPHLLLGHEGAVWVVAIDPLGRWIASAGQDGTIRLWPMPDLSKPPLHTLPREELIAKLKTLTNLRVVRDEESATGWKLAHDPFPGWETVPAW